MTYRNLAIGRSPGIRTALAAILSWGVLTGAAVAQTLVPQAGAGATPQPPSANVTLRPQLIIVGSSTMKPYVETTAQHLLTEWDVVAPTINLRGAAAGIAEFCRGLGPQFPDIVASSRGMHKSEFDRCIANGVLDIIEIKIGLSALYVVVKKGHATFDMTPRMLYTALAKQVAVNGEFVDNPYQNWHEINPNAPDLPIRVIVPDKSAGTRFHFDALFMEAGCRRVKEIDRIFAVADRVPKCVTLRTDHVGTEPAEMTMGPGGAMRAAPETPGDEFSRVVTEVPEPYGDKMAELIARSPDGTVAVMAGEVFDDYNSVLDTLTVGGVLPSDTAIERFEYDVATPNFFYFKRGNMRDNAGRGVVHGIREFMEELTRDELMGRDGIFVRDFGLVPLNRAALEAERRKVTTLKRFTR